MGKSQELYKKAKDLIPGGTQLLSKRQEMFLPDLWPAYYSKARGCEIWDLDGKKYIDMSNMGVGSCILGYADEDVNRAVKLAIDKANMSTLNAPEEVELAELLIKLHPWARMVRYARTGGEAMAIAVRIARAYSKKDVVLFCGYHGWHDWYLSANIGNTRALDGHLLPGLEACGVPRALKGTAIPVNYNDTKGFLRLTKRHKHKIAAVVMEPIRTYYPNKGFLEAIRDTTKQFGIILIFDEITSGWRLTYGGAHLKFKIYPDIAVFAKAISNGYPMAAIIGRKNIMNAAGSTFISSTYWTEMIGPAAALATIKKLKQKRVHFFLNRVGKIIQDNWKILARKHNLKITVSGTYPLSFFSFNYKNPYVLKTLFTQAMLEKGFLASTAFYVSYAHKDKYIGKYLKAVDGVFKLISRIIKERKPEKYLKSKVCLNQFRRLA